MPNVDGKVATWFEKRFGSEFKPTGSQQEWVKANWGKNDVSQKEWDAILPPIEQKVGGIKYILKHGEYGAWVSEQVSTLKDWSEILPLNPDEPESSKRAAKELSELMKLEDELKKDLVSASDITAPEWLIKDMLPQKTLNFIGGDAGIGKTLFILQMAACLMTGQPFLGHTTQKKKVLLIERDEPLHLLKAKIEKQSAKYSGLSALPIYKGAVRLDENPDKLKILIYLAKPDVVFIDSFSAIHYKDENSAMDMRPVLDNLRDLTAIFGITIICIHHFSRTNDPKQKGHLRGSTVIEAQSDFALGLHKSHDQLILSPLKARGIFEPINLMFNKDFLTYDVSGKLSERNKKLLRQSRVSQLLEANTSEEQIIDTILKEFVVSEKTVHRDLKNIKC
jgi:hypothetical protein